MPSLTLSQLETTSYDTIFDLIDTRSNVSDPRSASNTRQFVYSSDPFVKALNFSDFPYIVVEFPIIEYSNKSANYGDRQRIDFKIIITVRAARTGAVNNRNDLGRTDMLNIGDDLNELFNSVSQKKILSGYGIFDVTLNKESNDTIAVKEKQVYEAVYELNFWNRFQVSN